MSTAGLLSTVGDIMMHVGDIMSIVGDAIFCSLSTQDTPHGTYDIPHGSEHPSWYWSHIIQGVNNSFNFTWLAHQKPDSLTHEF